MHLKHCLCRVSPLPVRLACALCLRCLCALQHLPVPCVYGAGEGARSCRRCSGRCGWLEQCGRDQPVRLPATPNQHISLVLREVCWYIGLTTAPPGPQINIPAPLLSIFAHLSLLSFLASPLSPLLDRLLSSCLQTKISPVVICMKWRANFDLLLSLLSAPASFDINIPAWVFCMSSCKS